ncbi:hypothetical protein POM88_003881 [Heracleum sosnowskyi]|uniref:Wall-associated receptor kinase galacturonan-binding domain-containing protein n=1 Tax=Heracleum sosnowskyi TaxID=360622 RepID=A0AAD8JKG8_9APIA|nr:hypothetical protein POM88_003881 [Heracleum sosnowskyi]
MNAKLFRPHRYFLNPLSLIISILLLSLFIPRHHALNNIDMYNKCKEKTTRACGGKDIKGGLIEYPFWGTDIRPEYCGLEGFELSCEEEGDLAVDIGLDSKYRVAEVNLSASVLILNRFDDSLDDICASNLTNSTILDEKLLYDYGENTEEIHLFYHCDPPAVNTNGITSKFTCPSGDKKEVFFLRKDGLPEYRERLKSCKYGRLPVNKSVLEQQITKKEVEVQELFKGNIEVRYNKTYINACLDCFLTKGSCWNGTNITNNTCLYSNGTVLHPYGPSVGPSVLPPYGPSVVPPYPGSENKHLGPKIGIASGVVGCSILLLLVLITYCHRRKTKYDSSFFFKDAPSYSKDIEAFIRQYGSSIPKRYRLMLTKSRNKCKRNARQHDAGMTRPRQSLKMIIVT